MTRKNTFEVQGGPACAACRERRRDSVRQEKRDMSIIGKSIAPTISMIMLVVSLAVVSSTTAMGKGNRRTGNSARFQQGTDVKRRNVSPSRTQLRSASPRTRSFLHGDFSSFDSNIRRTNRGFIDLSQVYGSDNLRSRR